MNKTSLTHLIKTNQRSGSLDGTDRILVLNKLEDEKVEKMKEHDYSLMKEHVQHGIIFKIGLDEVVFIKDVAFQFMKGINMGR